MTFQPLINLRSTTIFKAFFINAIVIAIITSLTIEIKAGLDDWDSNMGEGWIVLITALSAAVIGFGAYVLARYAFGFGDGMLANEPPYPTLF